MKRERRGGEQKLFLWRRRKKEKISLLHVVFSRISILYPWLGQRGGGGGGERRRQGGSREGKRAREEASGGGRGRRT